MTKYAHKEQNARASEKLWVPYPGVHVPINEFIAIAGYRDCETPDLFISLQSTRPKIKRKVLGNLSAIHSVFLFQLPAMTPYRAARRRSPRSRVC
jgi:hypothetical protein